MLYRSYRPAQPLSNLIDNFWLYEDYESTHFQERILPSGTFEFVFNLRDQQLRIYKAARPKQCERFSGAIVSGPYHGYFLSDAAEETSVMGVHFAPGGAFPFLGFAADELVDSHTDLQAISGRSAVEIREQLVGARSPEERFQLLERWLVSRLLRPLERHPAVSLALNATGRTEPQAGVRGWARQAGLSERRFIDVFRREVGLKPKLFSRIRRFQEVLAHAHRDPSPHWAQYAAEYGYFDQSHLIRDFLAFSGLSPADYCRRLSELRQQGRHVKYNHLPILSQSASVFSNTTRLPLL